MVLPSLDWSAGAWNSFPCSPVLPCGFHTLSIDQGSKMSTRPEPQLQLFSINSGQCVSKAAKKKGGSVTLENPSHLRDRISTPVATSKSPTPAQKKGSETLENPSHLSETRGHSPLWRDDQDDPLGRRHSRHSGSVNRRVSVTVQRPCDSGADSQGALQFRLRGLGVGARRVPGAVPGYLDSRLSRQLRNRQIIPKA